MSSFIRKAEVEIGGLFATASDIKIRDLRIAFNIKKTTTSTSNKGRIEITNLAKETRDNIEEFGDSVILKVGYSDNPLDTLFIGNRGTFSHNKKSTEIITTLDYFDGGKELFDTVISIGYGENKFASYILEDIANRVNWTLENKATDVITNDKALVIGYSRVAAVKDIFDELTDMLGISWSFQNGSVVFQEVGGNSKSNLPLISVETGMIGIPEKTDKKGVKIRRKVTAKKSKKSQPGYVITTLLNPKIIPGEKIRLICKTLEIDGEFPVDEVRHKGDTYGADWTTKAKVLI